MLKYLRIENDIARIYDFQSIDQVRKKLQYDQHGTVKRISRHSSMISGDGARSVKSRRISVGEPSHKVHAATMTAGPHTL